MKSQKAEDIPLVPFTELQVAVKKVLSNTKKQSDEDIAKFQAANLKKRKARKDG
jgi:hypothetical protein